jgi:hypothetical protein
LIGQIEHRRISPYPMRHSTTNLHIVRIGLGEADFRSYLLMTQIGDGKVSRAATGVCLGTVRLERSALRLADLRIIIDMTDSRRFSDATRRELL